MTKFQFLFLTVFTLCTMTDVDAAKSWRVATPYPGNYEKKNPLQNMPDDPQSRMQKHMARMNRVFDPKKRQKENKNVEKAKAKLKREARMDVRGGGNRNKRKIKKPLFLFPGSKRNKENAEFPMVPSTSWYNS